MSLMGCVGSRSHEQLLLLVKEAVKENSHSRLKALLSDGLLSGEVIDRKHLLHQAAWLGYPHCVRILLDQGASPDRVHRKNGCTPLHLAHFCTVEDTNPEQTIKILIAAGADVNNPGKCGKLPLDHAIQHQRLDSVELLLEVHSQVHMQSVLIAIDVANSQIIELLLNAGGNCGHALDSVLYWGQPLHRVLYTPLKSPRECYKQNFRLLVQATVCVPVKHMEAGENPSRTASNRHLMIESELKTLSKDYVELTQYLYVYLIRNGFQPTDSIKDFMETLGDQVSWVEEYLNEPPSLKDLSIRVARSYTYLSGNILYGSRELHIPKKLTELIVLANPF